MKSIKGTATLLNGTGDLTIAWKEEDSDKIKSLIQSRINQGFSFFIIEKSFLGLFTKKSKVVRADDIPKNEDGRYSIELSDADVEELFLDGAVGVGQTPSGDISTTHRSTDIDEIVNSSSIAIQPMRAG